VAAVSDGATWIQELIDEQCPEAVRILDFPHAVGSLSRAAQAAWGVGRREAAVWLDEWTPTLKKETPEEVIAAIRTLPAPTSEASKKKRTAVRYLTTRLDQIRYADFQEQGYPIGSGIVESANKLVIEQRMKGSRVPACGCHWAPVTINPILALRGRLCSGQWASTWIGIAQAWRAQVVQRRDGGRTVRRAERAVQEALRSPTPTTVPPK